jgi:hypothetical protein
LSALWLILLSFLFRLTFGVALAMGMTSSKLVTSGFFRVHLWVLMGVGTFAALAAYANGQAMFPGRPQLPGLMFGASLGVALVSYVGAVVWMYEQEMLGKRLLAIVAAIALFAGLSAVRVNEFPAWRALFAADWISSALLIGSTTTAMLLGHWYLNTPTMKLAPLRRLLLLLAFAVALRAVVGALGLGLEVQHRLAAGTAMPFSWQMFLVLRWSAAILATGGLCWLTWLTLNIPNTQSATGILYAAVILVFIGELTSQLLSLETTFPV